MLRTLLRHQRYGDPCFVPWPVYFFVLWVKKKLGLPCKLLCMALWNIVCVDCLILLCFAIFYYCAYVCWIVKLVDWGEPQAAQIAENLYSIFTLVTYCTRWLGAISHLLYNGHVLIFVWNPQYFLLLSRVWRKIYVSSEKSLRGPW